MRTTKPGEERRARRRKRSPRPDPDERPQPKHAPGSDDDEVARLGSPVDESPEDKTDDGDLAGHDTRRQTGEDDSRRR